jgi:hypothetical protein
MIRYFAILAFAFTSTVLADEPANALPKAWHGHWKGKLVIHNEGGKETTVPMELIVKPKGARYDWQIAYGEGEKKQTRAYELAVLDKPGRFTIDEKNGIEIDARLVGSTMYCLFEVGGFLNDTRYRLEGDTLIFELTANSKKQSRTTSLTGSKTDVTSYAIPTVQRAELKRTKE